MKILYLYTEVMGYTIATIKELVEYGAEVHVVHWDHRKRTPYHPPSWPNVHMYKRSEMTVEAMKRLAYNLAPAITVVSGWRDKGYMEVAKRLRKNDRIVIAGLDGQWHGTLRQRIAAILGGLGYFSQYYSHAWVAGPYQFEYARRLGFDKKCIVYDLYSADLSLFYKAYHSNLPQQKNKYPHRFLFVGRFEPIKGLDALLNAWQTLHDKKRGWELILVGNGSLKTELQSTPSVIVKDFMQPEELLEEVAHAGCFVLPSQVEPWGAVVHEFAAAGLPLVVSDTVGATSTFLISGLNGYTFKANDVQDLAKAMEKILDSSNEELQFMAQKSHNLSQRISPQTSAANLLSILYTY